MSEDKNYDKLNYFHYVTLLYYIDDNSKYNILRDKLLNSINRKFINEIDPFTKTEYTLLFFDIINCPYVPIEYKNKIMINSHYTKEQNIQSEIEKITNFKTWFMDWDKDIDLERVLKKKEWISTY